MGIVEEQVVRSFKDMYIFHVYISTYTYTYTNRKKGVFTWKRDTTRLRTK